MGRLGRGQGAVRVGRQTGSQGVERAHAAPQRGVGAGVRHACQRVGASHRVSVRELGGRENQRPRPARGVEQGSAVGAQCAVRPFREQLPDELVGDQQLGRLVVRARRDELPKRSVFRAAAAQPLPDDRVYFRPVGRVLARKLPAEHVAEHGRVGVASVGRGGGERATSCQPRQPFGVRSDEVVGEFVVERLLRARAQQQPAGPWGKGIEHLTAHVVGDVHVGGVVDPGALAAVSSLQDESGGPASVVGVHRGDLGGLRLRSRRGQQRGCLGVVEGQLREPEFDHRVGHPVPVQGEDRRSAAREHQPETAVREPQQQVHVVGDVGRDEVVVVEHQCQPLARGDDRRDQRRQPLRREPGPTVRGDVHPELGQAAHDAGPEHVRLAEVLPRAVERDPRRVARTALGLHPLRDKRALARARGSRHHHEGGRVRAREGLQRPFTGHVVPGRGGDTETACRHRLRRDHGRGVGNSRGGLHREVPS